MLNRETIFTRYPWLAPGDEPHAVVIGDDLDAALSGLLYLTRHPNARIAGVYVNYTRVHFAAGLTWPDVLGAIWIDLDIYGRECRSLGHHIVRLSAADDLPGLSTSCNLNELAGRSVERDFRRKYPLGTIHFLAWLYDQAISGDDAEALMWLADSAFINGQSHRFRDNVADWLASAMPSPWLRAAFARIDERAFEERVARVQHRLKAKGFAQGAGQVESRHLRLTGFQCQPPNGGDAGAHMLRLLTFASNVTGWTCHARQIEALAALTSRQSGTRVPADVARVRERGLGRFLSEQRVFSYVFPTRHTINYTARLDSKDIDASVG